MKRNRIIKTKHQSWQEIYDADGVATLAKKIKEKVTSKEVTKLFKSASVKFASWENNKKIYWLEINTDLQEFWESEVKENLCRRAKPKLIEQTKLIEKVVKRNSNLRQSQKNQQYLSNYYNYCYFTSLWETKNLDKVIVLFMAH